MLTGTIGRDSRGASSSTGVDGSTITDCGIHSAACRSDCATTIHTGIISGIGIG
jgi:hypothetical protein